MRVLVAGGTGLIGHHVAAELGRRGHEVKALARRAPVPGALPDGRRAGAPVSEGISPSQGRDTKGPNAVIKSAARIDHARTGGTLLNMKFNPQVLAGDDAIDKLAHLIRAYFKLDGHHIQFNVITADKLRQAQERPEENRELIVRVAGYSDYFVDIGRDLQNEIIARTEQQSL